MLAFQKQMNKAGLDQRHQISPDYHLIHLATQNRGNLLIVVLTEPINWEQTSSKCIFRVKDLHTFCSIKWLILLRMTASLQRLRSNFSQSAGSGYCVHTSISNQIILSSQSLHKSVCE